LARIKNIILNCKFRKILPEIGNNHPTIETTNLKRIGNFCFILQIQKELTKKIENFHQLLKPQNLKQMKNYVPLLQIQGKNDKKLEIFTELSKPQNWSKLEILVYYCKFRKIWLKIGKICQTLKTTKLVKIQWPPLIVAQYFFLEKGHPQHLGQEEN
jgi:hypothetical protein